MKVSLEIRSGEGGEDAKLLVSDQATIYCKFAERVAAHIEVETEHG
jgi:protein subunit release factor A